MSSHMLEAAGLKRTSWRFAPRPAAPLVTWWPASLPGSDLDDEPGLRPRRPAKRPLRRGRIQFVAD